MSSKDKINIGSLFGLSLLSNKKEKNLKTEADFIDKELLYGFLEKVYEVFHFFDLNLNYSVKLKIVSILDLQL